MGLSLILREEYLRQKAKRELGEIDKGRVLSSLVYDYFALVMINYGEFSRSFNDKLFLSSINYFFNDNPSMFKDKRVLNNTKRLINSFYMDNEYYNNVKMKVMKVR